MPPVQSNPLARFAIASIAFGVPMGLFFSLSKGFERGMTVGLVAGLLFGLIITVFARRVQTAMSATAASVSWDPGEEVLTEGLANHFQGLVSNGGVLALTGRRVRFRGHGLNVSRYDRSWPLDQIESATATRTALVIPNGLRLVLRDGTVERFVVSQHGRWATAISDAIARRA